MLGDIALLAVGITVQLGRHSPVSSRYNGTGWGDIALLAVGITVQVGRHTPVSCRYNGTCWETYPS